MKTDREAWTRHLRDRQYQARMNRDHGGISEAEHRKAVERIRAELIAIGEDPEEPR